MLIYMSRIRRLAAQWNIANKQWSVSRFSYLLNVWNTEAKEWRQLGIHSSVLVRGRRQHNFITVPGSIRWPSCFLPRPHARTCRCSRGCRAWRRVSWGSRGWPSAQGQVARHGECSAHRQPILGGRGMLSTNYDKSVDQYEKPWVKHIATLYIRIYKYVYTCSIIHNCILVLTILTN